MTCPKVTLRGKPVILLSGYRPPRFPRMKHASDRLRIEKEEELRETVVRFPDAVAFGYVAGRWRPAV